ncbi:cytochrome c biogenesis protein CcsA [Longimicrobium sp.]|uniref:cytochrome c biogenesis protein CcsA n=1 Tax=Longimicrobium sp. TaxID=2029185 RepID=UPI002E2F66EE|nr:cytochrome c biogenesis protein CcsA [Longimicrobium sp.]HEX6041241.1 cytochrome c biogenesis protein CcsA [Longimicrobium sp.]
MSSPNLAVDDGSLQGLRRWSVGLGALAAASLVATFWLIFFYVPTEREMGIVHRIFYVHVPSAWVAFMAFGIVALCSLGYLWLRDERLDAVALCAAELGLVFTSIVLTTGPLWGKLAWGAWWVWDARLSFTLLLWFIYVGYFMLRGATENPERGKRFAAILGVVGAADIPIIHMSVQWFRSQHPKPVVLKPEGPTAAPEMVQTLLVSLLAFTLLFVSLLLARLVVEKLSRRLEAARIAATLRPITPASQGVSV